MFWVHDRLLFRVLIVRRDMTSHSEIIRSRLHYCPGDFCLTIGTKTIVTAARIYKRMFDSGPNHPPFSNIMLISWPLDAEIADDTFDAESATDILDSESGHFLINELPLELIQDIFMFVCNDVYIVGDSGLV